MNTIYLDNASTTLIKPEIFYQTLQESIKKSVNPARGNYQLSIDSSFDVFDTRQKLGTLIGCNDESHIIFTSGCTTSLNIAITGILGKLANSNKKLNVLMTPIEHNASARILNHYKKLGVIELFIPKYSINSVIDFEDLSYICKNIAIDIAVINHASNVTGQIVDIYKILELLPKNTKTIIDSAQILPYFNYKDLLPRIDALAIAGHKGLLGPLGLGGLYLAPSNHDIEPLIRGGTGSLSQSLDMPEIMPDRFEAGSMNAALIKSLGASLDYVSALNLGRSLENQHNICFELIELAQKFSSKIELLGIAKNIDFDDFKKRYMPIISFKIRNIADDMILNSLNENYSICLRGGFHCSTITHQSLGSNGALRISLSHFNTKSDIDTLISALKSLISSS